MIRWADTCKRCRFSSCRDSLVARIRVRASSRRILAGGCRLVVAPRWRAIMSTPTAITVTPEHVGDLHVVREAKLPSVGVVATGSE